MTQHVIVYRNPDYLTLGALQTAERAALSANEAAVQASSDAAEAVTVAGEAKAEAEQAKLPPYTPFASRAQASSASIPSSVQYINVAGLQYARDPYGTALETAGGVKWSPVGKVTLRHFTGAWAVDCGPGLRAARDYLNSIGGGDLWIDGLDNVASSYETRDLWSIGSVSSGITTQRATVFLDAGITLRGENRNTSRLTVIAPAPPAPHMLVGLVDYGHGGVFDLELVGPGAAVSNTHGILTCVSGPDYHAIHDLRIERVIIREVGSYGIGHQYCGMVGALVRDVIINDTGSDAIDWKVRSERGQETEDESVVFENIEVRRFGLREGAGSPSGLGIRGRAQLNNISVYEVEAGQVAIYLLPGVAAEDGRGDLRRTSFFCTLSNWYVEAANPRLDPPPVAVQVFASDRCVVGQGVAKWCTVKDGKAGPTPPRALFGPIYRGVVITPGHGVQYAAELGSDGAVADIVVQSDYDRFGVRSGTATVGQTVFDLPWGPPTPGFAVVRNGEILNAGFSVSGSTLILSDPLGPADDVQVVYPPTNAAIRVIGSNCAIQGYADRYIPFGVEPSSAVVGSTQTFGFYSASTPSIHPANNGPQLRSRGDNPDVDFMVRAKGSGSFRASSENSEGDLLRVTGLGPAHILINSVDYASVRVGGTGEGELRLQSSGDSPVALYSGGNRIFHAVGPEDNTNWMGVTGGAAGDPVQLGLSGGDATIDMWLRPKGPDGRLRYGTRVAAPDAPVTGYIEIRDAGGTLRKLAIID